MAEKIADFTATVRSEGQAAVIELRGEINNRADVALAAAYQEAAQLNAQSTVLDFNQVDYINSTGIALIVGLLAQARAARQPLAAVGLSEHYREIFTITRLSDFIEIR